MPTYNNLPAASQYFKGNWYRKLIEDLQLAGKAKRTVYGYVRAVRKLADFHQKSPHQIDSSELRAFLLHHIVEREVAAGTQSVLLSGIKFFFRTTCPREWEVLQQTKLNYVKTLPEVITQPQVFQIIDASRTRRMKTFVWTTYTLGLRIGEAVHLEVGDLDSQRMMVHIHRGKGAKDRYVPLPQSTLAALRLFWMTHRNPPRWRGDQRRSQAGLAESRFAARSAMRLIQSEPLGLSKTCVGLVALKVCASSVPNQTTALDHDHRHHRWASPSTGTLFDSANRHPIRTDSQPSSVASLWETGATWKQKPMAPLENLLRKLGPLEQKI